MITVPPPPKRPRRVRARTILLASLLLLVGGLVGGIVTYRELQPSQGPCAVMVFGINSTPLLPSQSTPLSPEAFERLRQNDAELARSRRVLNAALSSPEVRDLALIHSTDADPLTWLGKNLRVIVSPAPASTMTLELDGEDEAETVKVLAAIGKAYLTVSHERESASRARRQTELENAIAEYARDIRRESERMEEMNQVIGEPFMRFLPRAAGEEAILKAYERTATELQKVQLDREVFLVRPQALIEVAGGPGAATAHPTADPNRLDPLQGAVLEARERVLKGQLDAITKTLEKAKLYSFEMDSLAISKRIHEAQLQRLHEALQDLRLTAHDPPRVFVLEDAYFRKPK